MRLTGEIPGDNWMRRIEEFANSDDWSLSDWLRHEGSSELSHSDRRGQEK